MRQTKLARPERSRGALVRRSCEVPDQGPVVRDQGFLFRTGPVLHAAFERESLVACRRIFAPNQLDRTTALRPVGSKALFMLPKAFLQVVRMSGIKGAVAAAEDVDPELHWRSCRRPSTSLGTSELGLSHRLTPPASGRGVTIAALSRGRWPCSCRAGRRGGASGWP